MSLSTFCVIVGIYEIMLGVPLVVRPAVTGIWIRGFMKEDLLMRLIGFFFLVIGVLVLREGTSIGTDSAGIVRFLAWVITIKCFFLCWWPRWFSAMKDWYWEKPRLLRVFGVLATAFGVWLLGVSSSIEG